MLLERSRWNLSQMWWADVSCVFFLFSNSLKWTTPAMIHKTEKIRFFMNVWFCSQWNGPKIWPMVYCFPAIMYDWIFVTCQYLDARKRRCCGVTRMTKKMFNPQSLFLLEWASRANLFSFKIIPSLWRCNWMTLTLNFEFQTWSILQTWMIALGRFGEDSVWSY